MNNQFVSQPGLQTSSFTLNSSSYRQKSHSGLVGLAPAFALLFVSIALTSSGAQWTVVQELMQPRSAHTATVLDNGQILIVGGSFDGIPHHGMASCELFNPNTLEMRPAAPLRKARAHHQAVKLPNGKVLVSGGAGPGGVGGGFYLRSSELYDPATGTWTEVADMNVPAANHCLVLLDSGKVLRVCGPSLSGFGTATCELYDPAANKWTLTGSTGAAAHSRAVAKLSDGRVLTAGGYPFNDAVEIYDPAAGTWSLAGLLSHPVSGPSAAQLNDGRVLIMGGNYWAGTHRHFNSVHVYDVAAGTVSPGPSMPTARAIFPVVKLPSGDVLAISGSSSNANYSTTEACDLFTGATGQWQSAPALNVSRETEAVVAGGRVFAIGGIYLRSGTSVTLSTIEALSLDSDGDGVPDDRDQCPNTAPGSVVNHNGCSIAQLAPCDGPTQGGSWKSHGQFVAAVVAVAVDFLGGGLISEAQLEAVIRAAAQSGCGKQ
jgi:Kelch motif